jgi:hypothetical protein
MLADMSECSILYGNMVKQLNGKAFIDKGFQGRKITLLDLYLGTLNHSSAYIKRDLFNKYGLYNESLKIVSDWKFYLIAIGLNDEPVAYKDIDVTYFNMSGVSNSHLSLRKKERRLVLEHLLPATILEDYLTFGSHAQLIIKLKRYYLFNLIIRFMNKCVRYMDS